MFERNTAITHGQTTIINWTTRSNKENIRKTNSRSKARIALSAKSEFLNKEKTIMKSQRTDSDGKKGITYSRNLVQADMHLRRIALVVALFKCHPPYIDLSNHIENNLCEANSIGVK